MKRWRCFDACLLMCVLSALTLVMSNGPRVFAAGQRANDSASRRITPQYYDPRGEISVEGVRWELTEEGVAVTAPLRNVQFIQVRFRPAIRVLDASGNIITEAQLNTVSLPPHETLTIRRSIPLTPAQADRVDSVRISFLDRE